MMEIFETILLWANNSNNQLRANKLAFFKMKLPTTIHLQIIYV